MNRNKVVNRINDSKVLRLKDIVVEKFLIEKNNLLEYCDVKILTFDQQKNCRRK